MPIPEADLDRKTLRLRSALDRLGDTDTLDLGGVALAASMPRDLVTTAWPHGADPVRRLLVAGVCAFAAWPAAVFGQPRNLALDSLAILTDVTGSVKNASGSAKGSRTPDRKRTDLYKGVVRVLARTAQRTNRPMTVGRLCGVAETLWGSQNSDATVHRHDFRELEAVLRAGLDSCQPTTTAIPSAVREGGTDLIDGLRWLQRQKTSAHLVFLTDGIHQPPSRQASFSPAEFHAALETLPPQVRARLWFLGLDEAVRDEIAARVPRAWTVFSLDAALRELKRELADGR